MSPRLRVALSVVGVLLIAWLGALVFATQVVPAFLVPSNFKILRGGGDDQPPIIISDGSVQLKSGGTWTLVGNHYQSHWSWPANPADWLDVVVSAGATPSPTCSVPGPHFSTRDLELDGGDGSAATDVYEIKIDGKSGLAQVFIGNGVASLEPGDSILDLGGKLWGVLELKATTLVHENVDCLFAARPWQPGPPPNPVPPLPSIWVQPQ